MKSGLYTFDQLILDVKDATGYTNITNRHSEIKRLILRAERLINPFGSALVRKKMILYADNGNFDGVRFRKEEDFMFLDKVGCCEEGLCEGAYYESISHVIICDGQERESITYIYWAIQTDKNGNPFSTYNHSEAVVKFIVWQFVQQQYMLGEKSLNDVERLEVNFEDTAAFSRGEDFFPSEQSLRKMLLDNQTEKMVLFTEWERGADGCMECSCLPTVEENDPSATDPSLIWSFQFDDLKEVNDSIAIIDEDWLSVNGTSHTEEEILNGFEIEQTEVGRIGFVIKTTEEDLYQIKDLLNNNITNTVFTRTYNGVTSLDIYISETVYSNGSLYFKFEN